jgi:hypothetical protein
MNRENVGDRPGLQGIFFCALLVAFPAIASGQAWVPEKGEGINSTSYEYIAFGGHFRSDGSRTPEAASRSQSFLFDLEYGVTDRLAVTVAVPIVSARYASTNPPSDVLRVLFEEAVQAVGEGFYNHQFLDDLQYHTTLQDFQFNARYNLSSRPVVVTPFVGSAIPSHDYAYVGEASPGRNLKEFQFGTDVARGLDPFLRKAYVNGQLSFAIPEAALKLRTNRTNVSLEMGYSLNHKLAVRGIGLWQHTFTGLHFPDDLTTPERVLTHERLLKANYWHLGGGVSCAVNSSTDLSADVVTFLSGSDTHYGSGIALRISRSFMLKIPINHQRHSDVAQRGQER